LALFILIANHLKRKEFLLKARANAEGRATRGLSPSPTENAKHAPDKQTARG
jgi:hypothetical protein